MSQQILKRLALVAILGALGTGCESHLEQVNAFGRTSASFAEAAREAYDTANEIEVRRNMSTVALDKGAGPVDATFRRLFDVSPDAAATRPGLPAELEGFTLRMQGIDALGEYAKALSDLATADFETDISKAATDLGGAIGGLQETYKKATGKEIKFDGAILATAVQAVGTAITDEMRRQAIKTIVTKANDDVQTIAHQFAKDLAPGSAIQQTVTQSLMTLDGDLRQEYNTRKSLDQSTYASRMADLAEIRKAYLASVNSPQMFEDVSAATKNMAEGHQALYDAVTNNEFTSKRLMAAISDLSARVAKVKKFYKSLKGDGK